jgi:hypothetical protein
MVLLNGLRKYSATIFLIIIFCASATLAAANDLMPRSATNVQTTPPRIEPAKQKSGGLNSKYFADYFNDSSIMITAPEHPDLPVGSMNESLEDAVAITLHKDGDKIIWSLGPSLRALSLKPIDDINNIQIVLKYKF